MLVADSRAQAIRHDRYDVHNSAGDGFVQRPSLPAAAKSAATFRTGAYSYASPEPAAAA